MVYKFLLNGVAVDLIRDDKGKKTTLWLTMHPANNEPRFLCDLLSDRRTILFFDEPSKETPIEQYKK